MNDYEDLKRRVSEVDLEVLYNDDDHEYIFDRIIKLHSAGVHNAILLPFILRLYAEADTRYDIISSFENIREKEPEWINDHISNYIDPEMFWAKITADVINITSELKATLKFL